MAICFPATEVLAVFALTHAEDGSLKVSRLPSFSAISIASVRATRWHISDLLIVKPDHQLAILTHGLRELPLETYQETTASIPDDSMDVDAEASNPLVEHGGVVAVHEALDSSATLCCKDGWTTRANIGLLPQDFLTCQALRILDVALPADLHFALHQAFLEIWSSRGLPTYGGVEFECFTQALYRTFDLEDLPESAAVSLENHPWIILSKSRSHFDFREDPVLKKLQVPLNPDTPRLARQSRKPHKLLALVLHALHTVGEDLRLMTLQYKTLLRLAPVICRIALIIRPEWADYWKRLFPDILSSWPSSATTGSCKFSYSSSTLTTHL
jgi:anaphase-promoting complex subunit 1